MFRLLLLLLVIGFLGCVSLEVQEQDFESAPIPKYSYLIPIESLKIGMELSEVKKLLGDDVIYGYQIREDKKDGYKPLKITNPYREKSLGNQKKNLNVLYYFSHIKKADGIISDDELTPIVFKEDKLLGVGWDYLGKLSPLIK